jgi:hypothetical protein
LWPDPKQTAFGVLLGANVATYTIIQGIDTPNGRFEEGQTVSDSEIPSKSIKWLRESGVIELAETTSSTKKKAAPKAAPAEVEEDAG